MFKKYSLNYLLHAYNTYLSKIMKKDESKKVTFCTNMELSFLFLSLPPRKREGEKERTVQKVSFHDSSN